MPLTPTRTTTVPAATVEQYGASLDLRYRIPATGITAVANLTLTPLATVDGKLKAVGNPIQDNHNDVFADAANDPVLAAAITTIETAIQTYAAAKGLI